MRGTHKIMHTTHNLTKKWHFLRIFLSKNVKNGVKNDKKYKFMHVAHKKEMGDK